METTVSDCEKNIKKNKEIHFSKQELVVEGLTKKLQEMQLRIKQMKIMKQQQQQLQQQIEEEIINKIAP